ncbi:hypothetical protein ATANTOWER_006888 [Ataeniobius toweri]|uniref:Uncharacterized protein n=1 Tax=Ataeniobius toweri TaxID=208326 RepID=A0ABU7AZ46_9TELE|nr:hypothetical protein [Ataeniobius toweri]
MYCSRSMESEASRPGVDGKKHAVSQLPAIGPRERLLDTRCAIGHSVYITQPITVITRFRAFSPQSSHIAASPSSPTSRATEVSKLNEKTPKRKCSGHHRQKCILFY